MINALVAYKGKPARIVSQTMHKFALEFADGSLRSVREKDFRFIHPEFVQVDDACAHADIAVLEDFQEEILTLEEITQWLFDEYSAKNAWCSCILIEDGLYFYWQKDKVFIRLTAQVKSIQTKRDAQIIEAKNLKHCVDNLVNNTFDEQDLPYIEEIEKVALNQSKYAKILANIGIENTPESAYKLLLRLDYFKPSFNPYPARHDISKDEKIDVSMAQVERVDLTHLFSYAIDNADSNDADDAISIDGDKIWVHVADVSLIATAGSELDAYAQERASNLYLPEQIIHMLPVSATKMYALGLAETSSALSIGFTLESGEINNIEVLHSLIKVTNISYDDADGMLVSNEHLSRLQGITKAHKQYRDNCGAISLNLPNVDVSFKQGQVSITPQSSSQSRELVAEMMVMAGRVVAQFAADNDIVVPYAIQDEGEFPQETLDNKDALSLSESFKATKFFKRSATSTKYLPHFGLGLKAYLRITSPLRRYLDLLAHQQLSCFIKGEDILGKEDVKKIIGIYNANMSSVGRTVRSSNDHYKCVYLLDNPSWQGEGIVVDTRGDKALFMIPELGMMTQIKFKILPKLDEKIALKVTTVNLVDYRANFKAI
ncbi:exoribonuclease II [Abyssogena phaseoliformis symbiont OG214]|uniref:RNB domain-containing ribonuclease n=1 Tax=Abyssogena phaseoliformis symbiont TaxID=596095 RepID=UPI0019169951|nr:RNB domain-containing ribonuclease [Abyssogena phaseoliformis symbiont]MBW5289763.1 3'-to-5' exoribonuclease RNase R [Candidatus Ruthia sp. Apha_13_S6]BBB23046.1 exoribonuclease II [Abyssogena phaseoliformis symbiont OG214]